MGGRLHRGGEGDGGAGGEVGDRALMMAITFLINREALVALLTCSCGCLCLPPVAQCRKGHIYCRCNFSTRQCQSRLLSGIAGVPTGERVQDASRYKIQLECQIA